MSRKSEEGHSQHSSAAVSASLHSRPSSRSENFQAEDWLIRFSIDDPFNRLGLLNFCAQENRGRYMLC